MEKCPASNAWNWRREGKKIRWLFTHCNFQIRTRLEPSVDKPICCPAAFIFDLNCKSSSCKHLKDKHSVINRSRIQPMNRIYDSVRIQQQFIQQSASILSCDHQASWKGRVLQHLSGTMQGGWGFIFPTATCLQGACERLCPHVWGAPFFLTPIIMQSRQQLISIKYYNLKCIWSQIWASAWMDLWIDLMLISYWVMFNRCVFFLKIHNPSVQADFRAACREKEREEWGRKVGVGGGTHTYLVSSLRQNPSSSHRYVSQARLRGAAWDSCPQMECSTFKSEEAWQDL